MRLFAVRGDLAFSSLRPVLEETWPQRGGVPIDGGWDPPTLTPYDTRPRAFIAADCFALNARADGLVISDWARRRLDPLLSGCGELWPVRVADLSYWWFNCLKTVHDALDRDATEAEWGDVGGGWGSFRWITRTRRLAFQPEALAGAPAVFRVPEYPQGTLFVSEALAAAIAEHELTGFLCDVVWSREGGGVLDPPGISLGGVFEEWAAPEINARRATARKILRRRTAD